MFEYDASPSVRIEILEIALKTLFDVLGDKEELRAELVARMKARLKETGYDEARRHGLERAIDHISKLYGLG